MKSERKSIANYTTSIAVDKTVAEISMSIPLPITPNNTASLLLRPAGRAFFYVRKTMAS
jgi:hypothetical protein